MGKSERIIQIQKEFPPKFKGYLTKEDYINNNILYVEPMSAKEPLNEEQFNLLMSDDNYIAEVKKDGTRATVHLTKEGIRIFSRRISVKTEWFNENTDSLPHIRDLEFPDDYVGTVLDGELEIPGKEFKDISSVMNCLYDEAIYRQETLGKVVLNAFDIVYYKGVYVAKMPLHKRKYLLKRVIKDLNNKYIVEEPWAYKDIKVPVTDKLINLYNNMNNLKTKYPHLCEFIKNKELKNDLVLPNKYMWYEYVVLNGGEGLMIKHKDGIYTHTRSRDYTKIKKFITRDVIVVGYGQATEFYEGKDEEHWQYWGIYKGDDCIDVVEGNKPSSEFEVYPVTKFFAKGWIGTVIYGVIITDDELMKWQRTNPKEKPEIIKCKDFKILVVGDCSGFDEETREYISNNQYELLMKVIEVKGHEVLKTGKLRHPRFLRFREDKEYQRCIYKDHING